MYPPSRETFREFLTEHFGNTYFLIAEDNKGLIGILVFDRFNDGLSAVYCFYEPDREQESVGTTLILKLTQMCSLLHLPYNYLGYYVDGCRKMEYKARFKPLQLLEDDAWIAPFDREPLP